MKQFAYVILHYKNMKDTLDCIHSIQEKTDSPIVIVDNHTLSTSDQKKLSRYTKDIILLEDNLGFAKANNIGIRAFARELIVSGRREWFIGLTDNVCRIF